MHDAVHFPQKILIHFPNYNIDILIIIIIIIIIKTSSTGKIVYKLLSQPHKLLHHGKFKKIQLI